MYCRICHGSLKMGSVSIQGKNYRVCDKCWHIHWEKLRPKQDTGPRCQAKCHAKISSYLYKTDVKDRFGTMMCHGCFLYMLPSLMQQCNQETGTHV